MADIARIKSDIGKMIDQGAPEEDIDTYLQMEGVTIEDLHAQPQEQPQAAPEPQDERPWYEKAGEAVGDTVRLMADAGSFGMADRLAGYMSGEGVEAERAKTEEARKRAGWAGTAAEMVGGGGAALGLAKKGLTAARLVPGSATGLGGAIGRTAAMAADGAAMGAASAAGHDEDVGTGAILGAGAGAAGKVIGDAVTGTVKGAASVFNRKPVVPSVDELRSAKDAAYRLSEQAGVVIKPQALQRLRGDIVQKLTDFGYHPKMQPKIAAAVEEMDRIAQGNATLKGVDTFRKIANNARMSSDRAEAKLGSKVIEKIDDFLDGLGQQDVLMGNRQAGIGALQQARKLNTSMRKSELIDEAIRRAVDRTSSTGSGGNVDNALRQEFRRIIDRPKLSKGLTKDERQAMMEVIHGTPGRNLARLIGKLSPSGNGLSMLLQLGGAYASGGATIPAAAAGMGAKFTADRATRAAADRAGMIARAGGSRAAALPSPNAAQRLAEREREALQRLLAGGGVSLATQEQ